MALVYGIPFIAFKVAATARIKNPANGIYGTGLVSGTVTPVQQIRAIYDGRGPAGASLPYFVWGAKTGNPGSFESAPVFHEASVISSVTAHIFSAQQTSTDECDVLSDKLTRLFHHQPLPLVGFTTQIVSFEVIDIIPDPVGQHAILMFRPINRTNQV